MCLFKFMGYCIRHFIIIGIKSRDMLNASACRKHPPLWNDRLLTRLMRHRRRSKLIQTANLSSIKVERDPIHRQLPQSTPVQKN